MTITILNNVRAIPMYARVLHSELSVLVDDLASTSFALCNIKLATIVLMCLCLQNNQITIVTVISEIMEEVNVKMFAI